MRRRGPMSEDPEFHTVWAPDSYPRVTDSAVRYVPVTRNGVVMGYLWAAVTDDATGFVVRESVGDDAWNTAVAWTARLRWAKANDVSPLAALGRWAAEPEDPDAGFVAAGAEHEAASLSALQELAGGE